MALVTSRTILPRWVKHPASLVDCQKTAMQRNGTHLRKTCAILPGCRAPVGHRRWFRGRHERASPGFHGETRRGDGCQAVLACRVHISNAEPTCRFACGQRRRQRRPESVGQCLGDDRGLALSVGERRAGKLFRLSGRDAGWCADAQVGRRSGRLIVTRSDSTSTSALPQANRRTPPISSRTALARISPARQVMPSDPRPASSTTRRNAA